MQYEWYLEPRWGVELLHLIWNPETGEIGGGGATEIERMIAEYEELGTISTEPIPSAVDATDIRHSREQMAALIHHGWKLPDEIRPFYPKIEMSPNTGDGPWPVN